MPQSQDGGTRLPTPQLGGKSTSENPFEIPGVEYSKELALYGGQSDFCELVFPLGKICSADSAEYCRMFFVTPRFVTSKHTKQGHTVRIHGVLSHISRQDNPLLPRTDLRSHARTRASREQPTFGLRKQTLFRQPSRDDRATASRSTSGASTPTSSGQAPRSHPCSSQGLYCRPQG